MISEKNNKPHLRISNHFFSPKEFEILNKTIEDVLKRYTTNGIHSKLYFSDINANDLDFDKTYFKLVFNSQNKKEKNIITNTQKEISKLQKILHFFKIKKLEAPAQEITETELTEDINIILAKENRNYIPYLEIISNKNQLNSYDIVNHKRNISIDIYLSLINQYKNDFYKNKLEVDFIRKTLSFLDSLAHNEEIEKKEHPLNLKFGKKVDSLYLSNFVILNSIEDGFRSVAIYTNIDKISGSLFSYSNTNTTIEGLKSKYLIGEISAFKNIISDLILLKHEKKEDKIKELLPKANFIFKNSMSALRKIFHTSSFEDLDINEDYFNQTLQAGLSIQFQEDEFNLQNKDNNLFQLMKYLLQDIESISQFAKDLESLNEESNNSINYKSIFEFIDTIRKYYPIHFFRKKNNSINSEYIFATKEKDYSNSFSTKNGNLYLNIKDISSSYFFIDNFQKKKHIYNLIIMIDYLIYNQSNIKDNPPLESFKLFERECFDYLSMSKNQLQIPLNQEILSLIEDEQKSLIKQFCNVFFKISEFKTEEFFQEIQNFILQCEQRKSLDKEINISTQRIQKLTLPFFNEKTPSVSQEQLSKYQSKYREIILSEKFEKQNFNKEEKKVSLRKKKI